MVKSKRRRQKDTSSSESTYDPTLQIYDSSFKEWLKQHPALILPLLLKGAQYLETLDIERIRPTVRVDRVYKILYRGQVHLLHLEFESGTDPEMAERLLVYHAILYKDYHLPVISMIIYPFRVPVATSPWREMSGEETILTFHFQVLPLFSLEAGSILQQHLACLYPLLPTMKGANRALIEQAMAELTALYREDEVSLSQQLVWMELFLERVETITPVEKQQIQRSLGMYDPLWENHPKVKQIKAQAKIEAQEAVKKEVEAVEAQAKAAKAAEAQAKAAKAQAEAQAKAAKEQAKAIIAAAEAKAAAIQRSAELRLEQRTLEMAQARVEQAQREAERAKAEQARVAAKELRDAVLLVVKARFPNLAETARQRLPSIEQAEVLKYLIEQISLAPDEKYALWLLRPPVA